ncbi:MAG: tRNA (adenosine(37)-N6)-threonylcarbamoyltransferase complex ATPase subunit type 1 TsaE [Acidimicrobiales bacterium]
MTVPEVGAPRSVITRSVATLSVASPEATRQVAGQVARRARSGDIVVLVGDLGAGKTTFAQGFAAALGVTEPVTSPTFTLVREYTLDGLPGDDGPSPALATLFHADLYRLDTLGDVEDLGLAERVEDGGVAVVEWGDLGAPVLGPGVLTVRLEAGDEPDERVVVLEDEAGRWRDRWDDLVGSLAPWAPVVAVGSGRDAPTGGVPTSPGEQEVLSEQEAR